MGGYLHEHSLLLSTSRLVLPKQAEVILKTAANDINWTFLVQTAFEHGVTGLLCSSLLKLPHSLIPDEILDASREHLQQHRSANQALANQLTRILTGLANAGIEAIPFKGPTLAITAYGDLALRSFRDLDFLIPKAQIQPCLKTLQDMGYHQNMQLSPKQMQAFLEYSGQDILYGKGAPIEPHWAFAPSTLALDISYQDILNRAVEGSFNGQPTLHFAPEDELIILCIHGSKEKWTKLKWVADISEFIRSHPNLDWPQLFLRAESQGLSRMVRMGLDLANRLLDTQLPLTITTWIHKDRFILDWNKTLAKEFFNVEKRASSIYHLSPFHWHIRERHRDRWRYLYRTLKQPREKHFMDIHLPDRLLFLYTPYKLLHDYIALPTWNWTKKIGLPASPTKKYKNRER